MHPLVIKIINLVPKSLGKKVVIDVDLRYSKFSFKYCCVVCNFFNLVCLPFYRSNPKFILFATEPANSKCWCMGNLAVHVDNTLKFTIFYILPLPAKNVLTL